ncbi:MAG: MFS transporter [Candidatus ainarchaeum sp.]|nr:MFS transporter [Candidatus ainarchaeum sp.]
MRGFKHVYDHIRKYGFKHRALYAMAFLILFWTIFDGILEYIVPLVITGEAVSKTMMGIIIGTSSIAGFLFDILLCRIFKNATVRRMYLILFVICAFYPLILWQANTIWLYIIAMAIWGIYYDLFNVGRYDFVGRYVKKEEHASSFGLLSVFTAIGYLLSPLIAGFVIQETVVFTPFIMSWFFLGISFIFFIILLFTLKNGKANNVIPKEPEVKRRELYIWGQIGKLIFPVLIMTLMINVIDATFWTIGPLLVESWADLGILGSLFISAYLLPPLFMGWIIGPVTGLLGKKRTAIIALLLASIALIGFFFVPSHIVLIILALFIGLFVSVAYPANNSTYADYISESESVGTEIESQADIATNIGYVIGPILAGFLADTFGNIQAFGTIGIIGIGVSLILFLITPRKIKIKIKDPKHEKA